MSTIQPALNETSLVEVTQPTSALVPKPILPFDPQFQDTGISIVIKTPYKLNFHLRNKNKGSGNPPPLFMLDISDRLYHRVDKTYISPVIITSPNYVNENTSVEVYATYEEPLNHRRALTFLGYRGPIRYLFLINTNSVTQGSIGVTTIRGCAPGDINNYYPNISDGTHNSCQLINISTDRYFEIDCPYNELYEFVHSRARYANTGIRNYIAPVVNRLAFFPMSDLSTFDGSPSQITVRIMQTYGPEFEWLYPTKPINLRRSLVPAVNAQYEPYVYAFGFRFVSLVGTTYTFYNPFNNANFTFISTTSSNYEYDLPTSVNDGAYFSVVHTKDNYILAANLTISYVAADVDSRFDFVITNPLTDDTTSYAYTLMVPGFEFYILNNPQNDIVPPFVPRPVIPPA